MNPDPRISKLHGLAQGLYEIADTLNAEGVNCECCGSYRRVDFTEWALRQRIEGAVVTINNLADAFERLPAKKLKARQP